MINKLVNRLQPRQGRNQLPIGKLKKPFATWRRVALGKGTARMSADHEKHPRVCLLSAIALAPST